MHLSQLIFCFYNSGGTCFKGHQWGSIYKQRQFSSGRYFAERARFCLGHFWGAPGQNICSLEENQKILMISRKKGKNFDVFRKIFCYLDLKICNLLQKLWKYHSFEGAKSLDSGNVGKFGKSGWGRIFTCQGIFWLFLQNIHPCLEYSAPLDDQFMY